MKTFLMMSVQGKSKTPSINLDFSGSPNGPMPNTLTGQSWSVLNGVAKNTPVSESDNKVVNGDFSLWTGDNPDNWTVGGETGSTVEVTQRAANQGHAGSGTGACNIYTYSSGSAIQITQNCLTAGKYYRADLNMYRVAGSMRLNIGISGGPTSSTTGAKIITSLAVQAGVNFLRSGACDITLDDVVVKEITLHNLIAYNLYGTSDVIVKAKVAAITDLTQIGVVACVDNIDNPQNGLFGFIDRSSTTYTAKLWKLTSGSFGLTPIISSVVSFNAAKALEIRKSGNVVQFFYGDLQIGTNQTVAGYNGKYHGLFSTYSGNTFSTFSLVKAVLSNPLLTESTRTSIVEDIDYNAFPSMTQPTRNSRIYLCYKDGDDHNSTPSAIRIRTSDNNGSTWSAEGTILPAHATNRYADSQLSFAPNGDLLCSYVSLGDSYRRLWIVRSTDSGGSWGTPAEVSGDPFTNWSSGPGHMINVGGTLYWPIYGRDGDDIGYTVRVIKSTDNGNTWVLQGTPGDGKADNLEYEEPHLVIMQDGRWLCMIRVDNDYTIKKSWSTDNGVTWTHPVTCFSGRASAATIQLTNGTLVCINREPIYMYPEYSISTDLGETWATPRYFDSRALIGRRFMYGNLVEISDNNALAVWSTDNGADSGVADISWMTLSV